MSTLDLIRCKICGSSKNRIMGAMQGLNEDDNTISVDIYYQCDKKHEWVVTMFSENGGLWTKTEGGE